jgi:hypothetical protein
MAAKTEKARSIAALKGAETKRRNKALEEAGKLPYRAAKKKSTKKKASTLTEDLLAENEQAKAERVESQVLADERVRQLTREGRAKDRKLAKQSAGSDIILSEISDLLENKHINVVVPRSPAKDTRKKRVEIPVLCIGDIHMGHLHPHGEHAFNKEIAKARVDLTIEKFIETVRDRRTSAVIDECRLYLIGDMVEGEAMRPGHGHGIEGPVAVQAVQWAPEALTAAIVKLLGEFRTIKIMAVPGNHGRNGPAKGDAHPATNWDTVCYHTTRLMVDKAILQSKGGTGEIEWDLPSDRFQQGEGDSWMGVDYVFGWCNCLIHGEQLRGKGWGGIPFYAIERMARRYADIIADPIDFMYMGHIHVDAAIPSNYREVFVNGAIESSTDYARKDLVAATTPSQSAVFYTEENGPISRHKFYLGERAPQGNRTAKALAARK